MDQLKAKIRNVPDFPKPGILFYDITTLLRDGEGFRQAIEALAAPFKGQAIVEILAPQSSKQGNVYLLDRRRLPGNLERRPACSTDSATDASLLGPDPQPHLGKRGPLNVFGPYSDTYGAMDMARSRSVPAIFRDAQGTVHIFVTGNTKKEAASTTNVAPSIARLKIVTAGRTPWLAVEQIRTRSWSIETTQDPTDNGAGNCTDCHRLAVSNHKEVVAGVRDPKKWQLGSAWAFAVTATAATQKNKLDHSLISPIWMRPLPTIRQPVLADAIYHAGAEATAKRFKECARQFIDNNFDIRIRIRDCKFTLLGTPVTAPSPSPTPPRLPGPKRMD